MTPRTSQNVVTVHQPESELVVADQRQYAGDNLDNPPCISYRIFFRGFPERMWAREMQPFGSSCFGQGDAS